VPLCSFEALPDNAARGFDPLGQGRDAVFVVRRGDTVKAYRNVCPHQGASLPWRKHAYLNCEGTRIVCAAHGAQFDIDTGKCVQGAALGQSLEAVATLIIADTLHVLAQTETQPGIAL
jgi:nitrite reductase/ring-hydroxylating ferredoxin subunit